MTPKEKAEELVYKFLSHAGYKYDFDTHTELRDFHAKKCALIAVEEILNVYTKGGSFQRYCSSEANGDFLFYCEVKKEIENL